MELTANQIKALEMISQNLCIDEDFADVGIPEYEIDQLIDSEFVDYLPISGWFVLRDEGRLFLESKEQK